MPSGEVRVIIRSPRCVCSRSISRTAYSISTPFVIVSVSVTVPPSTNVTSSVLVTDEETSFAAVDDKVQVSARRTADSASIYPNP